MRWIYLVGMLMGLFGAVFLAANGKYWLAFLSFDAALVNLWCMEK